MKAVLFESRTEIKLVEMPDPAVADQDVLIQVGACGVCPTTLRGMEEMIRARCAER